METKIPLRIGVRERCEIFLIISIVSLFLASPLWAKKSPDLNSAKWELLLQTLNQAETSLAEQEKLPFTNSVDEELLNLNQEELKAINQKWETSKPKSFPNKKAEREEKNKFFHRSIEDLNSALYKALQRASFQKIDYRSKAQSALAKIDANPLSNPENVYQFKDGNQIGFCFSRALLIHYYLLKSGVPQSDIGKIFTVGELSVDGIFWNFHVAILLKDAKEGYLMVDPLQKQVLPYKEWLRINASYDIKAPYSRARFYFTSPRKFLPSTGAYELKLLQNPIYKNYFSKLLNSIE